MSTSLIPIYRDIQALCEHRELRYTIYIPRTSPCNTYDEFEVIGIVGPCKVGIHNEITLNSKDSISVRHLSTLNIDITFELWEIREGIEQTGLYLLFTYA